VAVSVSFWSGGAKTEHIGRRSCPPLNRSVFWLVEGCHPEQSEGPQVRLRHDEHRKSHSSSVTAIHELRRCSNSNGQQKMAPASRVTLVF
jgi:hypothetical protein